MKINRNLWFLCLPDFRAREQKTISGLKMLLRFLEILCTFLYQVQNFDSSIGIHQFAHSCGPICQNQCTPFSNFESLMNMKLMLYKTMQHAADITEGVTALKTTRNENVSYQAPSCLICYNITWVSLQQYRNRKNKKCQRKIKGCN